MAAFVVKPEPEQKTMWFLGWTLLFVLGLLTWLILHFVVGGYGFAICAAGWVVVLLPFLPWIPAYYRSLEYAIGEDVVVMKKGVFWRKRVTVPYGKITNVDVTQGPLQRHFNIGMVHVQTAGASGSQATHAELRMIGVRELDHLKDLVMEHVPGRSVSRTEQVPGESVTGGDSDILKNILSELKGIREVLGRRQG
jgi:membrane protein YdbS with pleckstrin-like domain